MNDPAVVAHSGRFGASSGASPHRQSTWIEQNLPGARLYDLLDGDLALRLARDPSLLTREVRADGIDEWIVIDEVQKVPALLDEVHRMIELDRRKFLLSGSSAQKLRRGGANLLAGRALNLQMFPLCYGEIGKTPPFNRIAFGMLPKAFLAERPRRFLESYASPR